jgi:hypothetical protein
MRGVYLVFQFVLLAFFFQICQHAYTQDLESSAIEQAAANFQAAESFNERVLALHHWHKVAFRQGIRHHGLVLPENDDPMIPSAAIGAIWEIVEKGERKDRGLALLFITKTQVSDRPKDLAIKAYAQLFEPQHDSFDLSRLSKIVIEGMTDELRDLLAQDFEKLLEYRSFEIYPLLAAAHPVRIYEQKSDLLWKQPLKPNSTEEIFLITVLEAHPEVGIANEISTKLFEQGPLLPPVGVTASLINYELLATARSSALDRITGALIVSMLESPEDQRAALSYYHNLARVFKRKYPERSGYLIDQVFEIASNPGTESEIRNRIISDLGWNLMTSRLFDEHHYQKMLLVYLPILVVTNPTHYQNRYQNPFRRFGHLSREFIGQDNEIYSAFHFFQVAFFPAFDDAFGDETDSAGKELLKAYAGQLEVNLSPLMRLDADLLLKNTTDRNNRMSIFVRELSTQYLTDESFDQFVRLLRGNNRTEFALDLVLQRNRISQESTEWLLQMIEDPEYHGQASIYFASRSWGETAESFYKSTLLRFEKFDHAAETKNDALANFCYQHADSDFFKSLSLKEFDQIFRALQRGDAQPTPEGIDRIFRVAKERIHHEEVNINQRIELLRDLLHWARAVESYCSEDTLTEMIAIADYGFENFFDASLDEALLMFYRSVIEIRPTLEDNYQTKVKELIETLTGGD